jgi:N-acetylglutamate synthase-like GNAT family acetyltransferase
MTGSPEAPRRFAVREAGADDRDSILEVLASNGQSVTDVLTPDTRYWVAASPEGVVGTVGLEARPPAALLRSASVLATWQRNGVGAALTETVASAAAASGCRRLYLFSTGAGAYWRRRGFLEVPVAEVVAALGDTLQVRKYERLGWLPTEVAYRLDLPGDAA